MACRIRQGARLGAAAAWLLAAAPTAHAALAFRRVEAGVLGDAVAALALYPRDGSLAIGDARGVGVLRGGGAPRRILRRGPVRDLAFLPAGELLVATGDGLYRLDAEGHGAPLSPGPGAAARDVRRIAVAADAQLVATGAGAFLSLDGVRWSRPSSRLPIAPARTVALRGDDSGYDGYAVVGERLWRLRLARGERGLVVREVVRELLPPAGEAGGPVDLAFGVPGTDVVALLPADFAVRDGPGAPWRRVHPALPPGARAQRLVVAHGRLWLATDRGLLEAPALAGPWTRAAGPAGSSPVAALAAADEALFVGAGDRIWVARAAAERAAAPVRLRTPEGDPPIEHVQRAALSYLDLGPERVGGLRRGVARRGWLPLMTLRLTRGRDEDRGTDHDEAFISGEVRRTVDSDRQVARDFEASLTFSWDLGDVAYHPEEIDVSREAREVIKLRDDVLDEVTQLYFERRRVLAELSALSDAPPPGEKLRLELRAAELAAGIDAWTGGWFSRARAGAP